MKLILTQEVSNLGSPGDVVDVKGGYGRNYLLPRGLAIRWSRGAEKQVASIRRAREAREIRDLDQARETADQLESLRVRVPMRTGETGRLFGSVTPNTIASAVAESGGPAIDKRRIQVRDPIKTLGLHQATVRVHPDVVATLEVEVVAA